jgi:ribonuclease VapC
MVIDTSALIAILQDEPERRRLTEAIEAAPRRRISTATLVETSIVLEPRNGS